MKTASDITHSQHDNTPDFRAFSAESGITMAAFFQAMQETDALIQQQEQTLLERVGKRQQFPQKIEKRRFFLNCLIDFLDTTRILRKKSDS